MRYIMATSSLFKTFTIEGRTEVENFVRMLDTEPVPITAFDVSRVNDSDEAWRKAVKENSLPWLQVYCPDGSSVFDDYDIQGFPTKIVLDTQGRVMKTFLGEDPAFYQYLDEILSVEH